VAMLVLLLGDPDREFRLREELVSRLARLGVTELALFRDKQTLGVVLEGWLFDPARSAGAVAQAVGARSGARTLHPIMHLAVSTTAREGGLDVREQATTPP
jgi:hypothetical protein